MDKEKVSQPKMGRKTQSLMIENAYIHMYL